jgi:hypothetical protein
MHTTCTCEVLIKNVKITQLKEIILEKWLHFLGFWRWLNHMVYFSSLTTSKIDFFFFFGRYGMCPFSSFWKEGYNWEHFQQYLRTIFFLEICTKNIKENWSLLWKIEKGQGVIWELRRWCLWGQKSSGWESVKFPLCCVAWNVGPVLFGGWRSN